MPGVVVLSVCKSLRTRSLSSLLLMSIIGWGSIHTKVQRLWRYQQLRWLWRRRNPCLYNRKMWKRILWILGRRKIASRSHSVFARCGGGKWSRALLVKQSPSPFIPAAEWGLIMSSVCALQPPVYQAPLLRKHCLCHNTVYTTSHCSVVFLHPRPPSH